MWEMKKRRNGGSVKKDRRIMEQHSFTFLALRWDCSDSSIPSSPRAVTFSTTSNPSSSSTSSSSLSSMGTTLVGLFELPNWNGKRTVNKGLIEWILEQMSEQWVN